MKNILKSRYINISDIEIIKKINYCGITMIKANGVVWAVDTKSLEKSLKGG